jgi:hypothetical protein
MPLFYDPRLEEALQQSQEQIRPYKQNNWKWASCLHSERDASWGP